MQVEENGVKNEALLRAVEEKVRVISENKPVTDGMSCDAFGNIWMTAVEHSSLCIASPRGSGIGIGVSDEQTVDYLNVIQNRDLLRWPDGNSQISKLLIGIV